MNHPWDDIETRVCRITKQLLKFNNLAENTTGMFAILSVIFNVGI